MTKEEADRIFNAWQAYLETADRFSKLMLTPPESFLPYPVDALEEALNIVAKRHFDAGDHKTSESIQSLMLLYLGGYYDSQLKRRMTNEEALVGMRKQLDLMLQRPDLMKALLDNLKKSQESWMESRVRHESREAPLTDREVANKFFREHPIDAFDIAMGKRGAPTRELSVAIYVRVCEEIEKSGDIDLMTQMMNSLDNMDLSAEAQKCGYRERLNAIEAGKEIVRARVKALEDKWHRQAYPGMLDQLAAHIKKLFRRPA